MKKIKLMIIIFFCVFSFILSCNAKITLQECEYTDEYKKYAESSKKEKEQYTIIPQMCKGLSYNVSSFAKAGTDSVSLPSSFDLRDVNGNNYVTNVKDQGTTETCWAFATNASIESNLLVNNLGEYDLSEAHMELSTQSTYKMWGSKFVRGFNSGGNFLVSSSYLLNGKGPVLEESYPFSVITDILNPTPDVSIASNTDLKQVLSVDNIYMIFNNTNKSCSEDIKNKIKSLIYNKGAVVANIYWQSSNSSNQYYYNQNNNDVNHEVTIVGWDDDVESSNFSNNPPGNGAWIVKNSGGESKGNNGYFYVSYYDNNICSNLAQFEVKDKKISDNTYYYDELGFNYIIKHEISENSKNNKYYIARRFKKKNNTNEKLDKITLFNYSIGQDYKIYIGDGSLNIIREVSNGTFSDSGYISFEPKNITISNSDEYFSVIVEYKNFESGNYVPVSIKTTDENDMFSGNEIIPDVDYISKDGEHWGNLVYLPAENEEVKSANLTIRAYTSNVSAGSSGENSNNGSTNNNGINDTEEIELIENPNNEKSYIGSSSSIEKNPKTMDLKINFLITVIILLLATIGLGYYKLIKLNNK